MKNIVLIFIVTVFLFSCQRTFTCDCSYSIRDTFKESTRYLVKRKNREADCNVYEFVTDSSKNECSILYLK